MRFKRVNYKNLRLSPGDKISPTYIRLVEKDSKLYQMIQKSPEATTTKITQENGEQPKKDFLATASENCSN